MATALAWAQEEFGGAALGDLRRVRRLVRLAAAAANTPAGTVTAVVRTSAAREGAFRLLESDHVSAAAVGEATWAAAVRRSAAYPWVHVPLDGSSLSLTDRVGGRDVGTVGTLREGGRGLLVASALAVSPDGSPLGVCGQRYWARKQRAKRRKPFFALETETRHGVDLLDEVHARFTDQAPGTEPWFQLDRGYDNWPILQRAHARAMRITVRASHNRCVRESRHEAPRYLFDEVRRAPVLGAYALEVPARPNRPARVARMRVRACRVTIELRVAKKRREYVPMYVVLAEETRGTAPLHWILLTSVAVHDLADARAVIDGYTARWRIEEFHRAWKQGVCNVEDTQLRSREAIVKWATILAAVAARATRLTYLAREKPEIPATDELSREEIDATIALLQPKGVNLGATPTLHQAVRWIADLGGYAGGSSGRPPGPTVVARGLEHVEILARGIRNLAKMR